MFIDPQHLLSSITSNSQPNRSIINYTHIPHPIRSTAPAPHMTCSIELSSITPAPFLMSVGLGVLLAVTVTVTAGRGMLLDFVVELVIVAIVVEKESVVVEGAGGREVGLESEIEVEESVLFRANPNLTLQVHQTTSHVTPRRSTHPRFTSTSPILTGLHCALHRLTSTHPFCLGVLITCRAAIESANSCREGLRGARMWNTES